METLQELLDKVVWYTPESDKKKMEMGTLAKEFEKITLRIKVLIEKLEKIDQECFPSRRCNKKELDLIRDNVENYPEYEEIRNNEKKTISEWIESKEEQWKNEISYDWNWSDGVWCVFMDLDKSKRGNEFEELATWMWKSYGYEHAKVTRNDKYSDIEVAKRINDKPFIMEVKYARTSARTKENYNGHVTHTLDQIRVDIEGSTMPAKYDCLLLGLAYPKEHRYYPAQWFLLTKDELQKWNEYEDKYVLSMSAQHRGKIDTQILQTTIYNLKLLYKYGGDGTFFSVVKKFERLVREGKI